jgi:hypothetical protein
MLVLPVAAPGFDAIPSICFNEPDNFSDFHQSSLDPTFRDPIEQANGRGLLDRESQASVGSRTATLHNLILLDGHLKT